MEKQKKEEEKVPGCNSKWSQDEGSEVCLCLLSVVCLDKWYLKKNKKMMLIMFLCFVWQVWCDHGYPRLVQRPLEIALTGKMSKRCACFNETDLDQPGLEVYQGCGYLSKVCRLWVPWNKVLLFIYCIRCLFSL